MAVVCTTVLPSAVVWLMPYSSHCNAGEYCCHVVHCSLPGVVCGWWVCVCAVRVVGYPLSAPPSSWWWVGPSWMVGWHSGWWVAWWVKGGSVTDSPSCAWCPPSVCWRPPCRLPCGPVEWRGVVGVCCPCVRIGPPPSHCSRPSCVVSSIPFSHFPPSVFSVTALLV